MGGMASASASGSLSAAASIGSGSTAAGSAGAAADGADGCLFSKQPPVAAAAAIASIHDTRFIKPPIREAGMPGCINVLGI
jgi:hypothetical protein